MTTINSNRPAAVPAPELETIPTDNAPVERTTTAEKKKASESSEKITKQTVSATTTAAPANDVVDQSFLTHLPAGLGALFMPLQSTMVADTNTPQALQEFAQLFQSFDIGKPSGVGIGDPLKDWKPAFNERGAAMPSLVFSPALFKRAVEIVAAKLQGQGTPREGGAEATQAQRRAEAFVKLFQHEGAAGQLLFERMSPAQQAAVTQVALACGPIVREAMREAGGSRSGKGDDKEKDKKDTKGVGARESSGKTQAAPDAKHARVEGVESKDPEKDELALLDSTQTGEAKESTQAQEVAQAQHSDEAAQMQEVLSLLDGVRQNGEVDASSLENGPVVTSPLMNKLEQTAFSDGFPIDLVNGDVSELVQVILFKIGNDVDLDLGEAIKEMKESNAKNDALRKQMQQVREQKTAMEDAFRKRYHERTTMDPSNPLYIDQTRTTFEDYKALQKLEQTGTADSPEYRVSPNEPRFARSTEEERDLDGLTISQRDVDLANMAGVTPTNMASLRRCYNDPDADWSSKYASFEDFLANEVGLHTPAPEGVNQNETIKTWRDSHDPTAEFDRLADEYDVPYDDIRNLAAHREGLPASEQGESLQAWLESEVGLSATAGEEANSDRVAEFADEIEAAREARLSSADMQRLREDFDLTEEQFAFLEAYLEKRDGGSPDVETLRDFIGTPLPDGAGCQEGQNNTEAIKAFVAAERARLSQGSLAETDLAGPLATALRAYGEFTTMDEALSFVRSKASDPTKWAELKQAMDAIFAQLPDPPRADIKTKLDEVIHCAFASKDGDGTGAGAGSQANLEAAVASLNRALEGITPAETRAAFEQYVTLTMTGVTEELRAAPDTRTLADHFGNSLLAGVNHNGSAAFGTGYRAQGLDDNVLTRTGHDYDDFTNNDEVGGATMVMGQLTVSFTDHAGSAAAIDANSELLGMLKSYDDGAFRPVQTSDTRAAQADEDTQIADRYQLSSRQMTFLHQIFDNLPASAKGAMTFEEFLKSSPPGPGLVADENNMARMRAFAEGPDSGISRIANMEMSRAENTAWAAWVFGVIFTGGQLIENATTARTPEEIAAAEERALPPGAISESESVDAERTRIADNYQLSDAQMTFLEQVYGNLPATLKGSMTLEDFMKSNPPGPGLAAGEDNLARMTAFVEGDPNALQRLATDPSLTEEERSAWAGFLSAVRSDDRFLESARTPRTAEEIAAADARATAAAEADARAAMADKFRVEVDHSTDQGEQQQVREVSLSHLENELDRLKDLKDSQSELNETMSLRLQILMGRRSKVFEILSNIIKKKNDTGAAINNNIK